MTFATARAELDSQGYTLLKGFGDFANCSAWQREALIGITTKEMFRHYLQTYRTERDERDSIPEEVRPWNPIVNKGDEDGDPEDGELGIGRYASLRKKNC